MIDTNNPRERRLVLRLLAFWREIAGERSMPAPADVDGSRIPEMWGHCFLVDVRPADEPVFDYVGEHHLNGFVRDPKGRPLSAAGADTLLRQAVSYHRQVLARGIPITLGGQFVTTGGRTVIYRSILLPLGEDGRIVGLLGGANCRELTDGEGILDAR